MQGHHRKGVGEQGWVDQTVFLGKLSYQMLMRSVENLNARRGRRLRNWGNDCGEVERFKNTRVITS